jgi:hypothetical protein
MKHIVVEADQIFQWDGREWLTVPWGRVEANWWIGEAYLWPSREAAKRCWFIPPVEYEAWAKVTRLRRRCRHRSVPVWYPGDALRKAGWNNRCPKCGAHLR